MIRLTEQQARALDAFIADKYSAWRNTALDYMGDDEIDALEKTLSGECPILANQAATDKGGA